MLLELVTRSLICFRCSWTSISIRQPLFSVPFSSSSEKHDYATSHAVAEKWFHQVKAPQKRLIRFADASHMIMQEQPGRFLQHLIDDVRPLAVRTGDAAPDEIMER